MDQKSNKEPYIMGLGVKLGVHCGKVAGSVCNRLTANRSNPKREKLIQFKEAEKNIGSQNFDEFFKSISVDNSLIRDW